MKIFQLHNKSGIQVSTQNDKLFLLYSYFQSNLAMKHLQSIRKLHRQEDILYLFLSLCLQMPHTSTEAYCFQKTNPPVFCRGKIAFAGKCIFFALRAFALNIFCCFMFPPKFSEASMQNIHSNCLKHNVRPKT